MKLAKLFKSGNSQAVRLPKEFQMEGSEVYIKRVGPNVVLTPMGEAWTSFFSGLDMFSEDFMEGKGRSKAVTLEKM